MGLPKKRKFFFKRKLFIRSQNLMRKVWRHFGKIRRYYFREVLGSHANFTTDFTNDLFATKREAKSLKQKVVILEDTEIKLSLGI